MNVDWKAVITSLVTAVVTILASFGVIVPPEWQNIIIILGVAIMVLLPSILPKKK